jgi:thioredoxin-like negative regulator of GroEL
MKKYILLIAFAALAPRMLFSLNNPTGGRVIHLDEQKDKSIETISASGDTILCFYSPSCPPCQRMSPLLDTAAQELHQYSFIKVRCHSFPALVKKYNITQIPTLVFLRNGKEIGRYAQGPLSSKKLKRFIIKTFK